jgi:hypothetical protein
VRVGWLADVCRAADLVVVEEPGWHGRGYEFPSDRIEGVVCHHTVSNPPADCPSVGVVTNGRPDLAGPLAQIVLCRSGEVHVIADGVANHAGSGSWPGIVLGNKDTIGIEAENTGTGEPWPEQQMDCYVRLVAALLEHNGLEADRVCSHYEWRDPAGYKIDPYGVWVGQSEDWYDGHASAASASMNEFRWRVEGAMAGMTPAQEAKLDKVLELCDVILRPKLDSVYIQVEADDHDDTLAGRVLGLTRDGERRAIDHDPQHRVAPIITFRGRRIGVMANMDPQTGTIEILFDDDPPG